ELVHPKARDRRRLLLPASMWGVDKVQVPCRPVKSQRVLERCTYRPGAIPPVLHSLVVQGVSLLLGGRGGISIEHRDPYNHAAELRHVLRSKEIADYTVAP